MHEVLVNRLGGLSLPRKSVVRLTDRPDMTLDVYRGRKTTMQQQIHLVLFSAALTELAKSTPVHSLILSSHVFFCPFSFSFAVPCRIVFAKSKDHETWPNHRSFRFRFLTSFGSS